MKFFLTIIFIVSACIFLDENICAATITVGNNRTFTSIKTALQHCRNGDTVLVEKGLYKEHEIVIDKSVVLKGIQQPVLDGEHQYQIFFVKANNVVIDGFKLQHSGRSDMDDIAAIKIYNAHNVVVSNNIIEDAFWGILTQLGVNCVIINNRLKAYADETNSGNGIHCWKCDSMHISGNYITGHRDGIYFEFVTNSVIQKNISENNIRYGLHFMFSHNDEYISNIFQRNGSGVAVMFSHGVKMIDNAFVENWGGGAYGILLKEISDSYIYHNRFVRNTVGIHMEGATRISVEKNIFNGNGWAMRVQASCSGSTITYNNFLNNTFDVSTNGSLVLTTFDHNYWDKYEGYDLNKDRVGDVPYRPVSLFSMIAEENPSAMMLFRSFIVTLFDKTERILPGIIPENLKDNFPYDETFTLMIIASNLTKRFGKLKALDDVSVNCNKGECIALMGPNGSGKTTLIKCILGMVVPDSGFITFNDKNILHDWQYRYHIGYMPQIGRYPENMTIGQVIEMIKDIRHAQHAGFDEELIKSFGLDGILKKRMRTLSGGTRQKVSASLAFLFNTDVLILDEPTAGLDPISAEILKEKIKAEKRKGKLILITSHILSDLDELVTQVMYMQEGKLLFHKHINELRNETGEQKLAKAIVNVMHANNA